MSMMQAMQQATAPPLTCLCGSIGNTDGLRLCSLCHRYWRNDKKLISVSRVIKTCWPLKPDFSKAPPEKLENARDRGTVVDGLFSAYVNDELDCIPRGTREDAVALFHKIRRWWDDHVHHEYKAQVLLADDVIAGTCDVVSDDWVYDLKTTYNIEPTYPLQVAAYAQLYFATFARPVKGVGIIHLTERFPAPKIIKIDLDEALQDWLTIRQMFELVQRRAKKLPEVDDDDF